MANLFTDIPEKEPISFYKGETIVWKRTDIGADYDPSSHSMVWEASLETDGSTRFSATVTESGTEYTFTLDDSATANYTAGDYFWVLKVIQTSDSEKLVIDSVKKTNRLVCVEESWPFASVGSEIAFFVQKEAFDYLDAPIVKVNSADTPMPYSSFLENKYLPQVEDIVLALENVCYI